MIAKSKTYMRDGVKDLEKKKSILKRLLKKVERDSLKMIYLDEVNFTKQTNARLEYSNKNDNIKLREKSVYQSYFSVVAAISRERGIEAFLIKKKAIDKVTKLKNRFSTNSRVFLSAFVEYIIKQLALNGTVCCVADKKKIIQLSHILDTTKEGFEKRFPLYPLIVNLDTFKQAQEYLNKPPTAKVVAVVPATTDVDDSSDEKSDAPVKKVKVEKDTDVFTLDGVSLDTQYQFRYYIAESCRETRMDLAKSAVDADGELMTVYNYTSVSKIFKNFCSTLICEFLMRIGNMLAKEIETRGIKTVNDTIIGTVISHYHTVCGVDETATIDFIRTVTTKYYKYVAERQKKRNEVKAAEDASTGGDLPYTE